MLPPILHFEQHGQSNALGTYAFENSSNSSIRSSAALTGALMFRNCITAWQPDSANPSWTEADKRAHFVAMVEKKMGSDGETGMYGLCEAFKSLVSAENGVSAGTDGYQLIGSVAGQGNKRADEISQGSAYWQRLVDDIHYANLRCAAGLFPSGGPDRYSFGGKVLTVAENDQSAQTNPATYKATLEQMSADIDAEVYAETGVQATTPAIIYQPASHASNGTFNPEIALALLELALETNEFHLSSPTYHLPYADTVHLNAYGTYRLGLHAGLAMKRVIVDGINWKPLHVIAHQRVGVWLELELAGGAFDCPETVDGQIGLVFDHSTVSAAYGKGFTLRNSAGVLNDFREAKAIGNKIILRYDNSVTSGSVLTYAIEGSGVGPTSGPRGNMRDNQGNKIKVDGYALHNWLPIFRLTLA